ncbi:MAG: triple tyrosine motif-containing protein, partial [Chloroflexi bacterium]|nr:triple tyrosine motif-containing protein [Chloroflexota bacterium]
SYTLENFDSNWKTLGNQHSGLYTNLPGGTYTLRLKASNNDGIWNEVGKSIKVTVIPPFWQTWWFYTLAGLLTVGVIAGIYRLRVHSIETQKRELERQVQERTREIKDLFEQTKELAIIEERNRLARDLHDSAKQKAFAALAQIGTANGMININVNSAKEHLGEAENLVSDVIQELTFLIQEMYPLALKEKGLATSLREYAFEWENRTDIPVSVKIDGEHRLKLEIEQAVYRIVQESLANIARHSQARNVTLTAHFNVTHIELEIVDNGRGFVPGNSSNGIGLRMICELAESVGGQVTIESEPGHGTRVVIDIPTDGTIALRELEK